MTLKWWQKAIFYQIYPRSFADGNGDGIGDFPGITSKLDYLQELGVDAIWLSPHFPSPQYDCGYDVTDYCGVAPEYGTLQDFEVFLQAAHARGIRVILDLVLNHTSHLHPWFSESRLSRHNPRRDWYIWRDGKNGGPPNNWSSLFDGSAWEFDAQTGQYYYHHFLKEQPDLNWRNPEVKAAMWEAVRFWLRLGVDGFRLDAIASTFERQDLPDSTSGYDLAQLRALDRAEKPLSRAKIRKLWAKTFEHQFTQPGLHELMKELRLVMDEFPGDRMLVGEDEEIAFHGNGSDELDLVFNFPLMRRIPFRPAAVRRNQAERLSKLAKVNGWPCNTLGNHDSGHFISHFKAEEAEAQARLHTAALLTLRGTPFLYNGDEIGMDHLILERIEDIRDVTANWVYQTDRNLLQLSHEAALAHAVSATRDKGRTPMHWHNAPQGGFCPADVRPWLPVNPNYAQGINAADQANDPKSLLNFHRRLIQLRRAYPCLADGEQAVLHEHSRHILAFLRWNAGQRVLVALNFSAQARRFHWRSAAVAQGGLQDAQPELIYSLSNPAVKQNTLLLAPYDIILLKLTNGIT